MKMTSEAGYLRTNFCVYSSINLKGKLMTVVTTYQLAQ